MTAKKKLRLKVGEILLKISSLTPEQLEDALVTWKEKEFAKLLGEILVAKGYVSQQDVEKALAIQYGYPYIQLSNFHLDPEVCKIIPRQLAMAHKIIPMEKMGNILTVAMISVFDKVIIKHIEEIYGYKVRIFLANAQDIEEALRRYY